ncbi:MAG TPA: hypothetical protein VKB65_09525, partial [Myxococcota bacterium]|nr:hypothetical protein [Myxococcota bacterium]
SHTPVAPGGWRWARATVFTVGALVVAQQLYGAWAVRLVFEDTTPLERRHLAAERLYVLGLDTPDVWLLVARRAEAEGDLGMATSSYRWGLSQYAQIPPLWAVERLAWLLVQEQPEGEDSLEEALRLAGHLVERLGDGRPDGYRVLAAAHAAAGNWKEAIRAAEWALTTAEIHGDGATIPELSANALSYRNDAFAELRP